MVRRIVAICVLAAVMTAAHLAAACTVPQPYDPNTTFQHLTREDVVQLAEVIVEGVIEPYKPAAGEPDDSIGFTKMRIDRVLKGELGSSAVVIFLTGSSDCSQPPPFGQRLRFGADLVEKGILLDSGHLVLTLQRRSLLETNNDVLYFGRSSRGFLPYALPLADAELDRLLAEHQTATGTLEARATAGGGQARLDYADYLTEQNEVHRALKVYEAVYRDSPGDLDLELTLAVARAKVFPSREPDATLAAIAQQAPKTDEWRNKIARTRLTATGKFTSGWKNWSNLKPAGKCDGRHQKFDGATFDDSDLAGCDFQSSSFVGASFRHARLSDADLSWATMTGAKYDCATRFPDDFDPVKQGMVNVEDQCDAK